MNLRKNLDTTVGRYVNEAGGFIQEFNSDILEKYNQEIMGKIDC
jgi:hypothetical protein